MRSLSRSKPKRIQIGEIRENHIIVRSLCGSKLREQSRRVRAYNTFICSIYRKERDKFVMGCKTVTNRTVINTKVNISIHSF